VTPSSGFPTDLRRSGCHSESHQPRTLRTRCRHDSRGWPEGSQGRSKRTVRKLRLFRYAPIRTAKTPTCSRSLEEKKGAGLSEPGRGSRRLDGGSLRSVGAGFAGAVVEQFAEPGTLSSTVPTDLPLPRTAAREASSYRRPVLGAGRTLCESEHVDQGRRQTNFALFATAGRTPALRDMSKGLPLDQRRECAKCAHRHPVRVGR
jgi:hypothetical protein